MEVFALIIIVAAGICAAIQAFRSPAPVHLGWLAVTLVCAALLLWFALGVGPVAEVKE